MTLASKLTPRGAADLGISHISGAGERRRTVTQHNKRPRTPSDIIATMLLLVMLLLLLLRPRQAALQGQARNAGADVAPSRDRGGVNRRD